MGQNFTEKIPARQDLKRGREETGRGEKYSIGIMEKITVRNDKVNKILNISHHHTWPAP